MISFEDEFVFGPEAVDSGIPGEFMAIFVIVGLLAVASVVWRVSVARRMATRAGMDPDEATMMTLLSDDGLDATYLASNLRGDRPPAEPSTRGTTSERLGELQDLRDQGLVTEAEYADRRRAILDEL